MSAAELVLSLTSYACARRERRTGREEKFEGTDREKLAKAALVIYRGLLACAAFAAFTLLQPPATTCLLSDWQVPPWLYNSLLGMIGALASVSSQFTGGVSCFSSIMTACIPTTWCTLDVLLLLLRRHCCERAAGVQ